MLTKIFKKAFVFNSLAINKSAFRSINTNIYPSKAVFYVPASDPRKISKIFASNADCIVLDIEDGVAFDRKIDARLNIRNLYKTDERIQNDLDNKYAVRINRPFSELAKEDIKHLFEDSSKKSIPKCIFVPKTNSPDDIKWLFDKLNNSIETNKDSNQINNLNMFFYMESAISLVNLREIIETSVDLSTNTYRCRFKLEGFVFGSDDYCADISATRTKDAFELIYARQKLVAYCKAFNLKAIDMVYIDLKDLEGLKAQSEQGYRMGFSGKQVIHPAQVDIVQEAFKPSEAKIKWATGLVEAFKLSQKSGAGAFIYMGQMIDMPSLLQAQNILSTVQKTNRN